MSKPHLIAGLYCLAMMFFQASQVQAFNWQNSTYIAIGCLLGGYLISKELMKLSAKKSASAITKA